MEALSQELAEFRIALSDFEIGKSIGHGGFSEVYLGMQRSTGKLCAIKILNAKVLNGDSFIVYEREVRILSKGRNRFILGFVGFTTKYPYTIVTEYASQGTLYDAIHHTEGSPRLNGTQKTIIALGTAYAMHRLHKIRVIHRDLKSLNILLDSECLPKICDFGLSRCVDNKDTFLTMDIGTPHWMAPELFDKHDYTNKVDVYAYGMLLWEMVSGTYPFKGRSAVEIAYSVCKLHERPPIPHRVSREMRDLINECWAQDPSARPSFRRIYKKFASGEIKFSGTDESAVERLVRSLKDDETGEPSPPPSKRAVTGGPVLHSLPEELKSDRPPPQLARSKVLDLEPLKDCFSAHFIDNLEKIRLELTALDAEAFFRVLLPHFRNDRKLVRVNVMAAILNTTAELIDSRQSFLQVFVQMGILEWIPIDNLQLVDSLFHVLLPIFMKAPTLIQKNVFDTLVTWIPTRPLYVMRLVNVYTCMHPPMECFWAAADLLITQTNAFQQAECETYLRLLYTLCNLIDVFLTGRFRYIVNILLKIIATQKGSSARLAYQILASVVEGPASETLTVDVSVLLPSLKDSEMAFYAMSILLRLKQQQPTYNVILELLNLAKDSDLACSLLLQYCEIEVVAVKMADTIDTWILDQRPNLECNLKLVMLIMCHVRARKYLIRSHSLQQFFVTVAKTKKPQLVAAVGLVNATFRPTPEFVAILHDTGFLETYIDLASQGGSDTLLGCFELLKGLGKVAYDPAYLRMLPVLKKLAADKGDWQAFVVSLIVTLSRYPEVRAGIRDAGLEALIASVSTTDPTVRKQLAKFAKNMQSD